MKGAVMSDNNPHRLIEVKLDEKTIVRRNPEVENERKIAIFDLLEENYFELVDQTGPYSLTISLEENRLLFDIRSQAGDPIKAIVLSLSPFRKIVKDYFQICESYYEAIKHSSPQQIEALDMGRRGLHNEGSDLLRERLDGKVVLDKNTARRLFTIICVLHIRG